MSAYDPTDIPPQVKPRVKKLRLIFILFGLGLLAAVSTVFGMMMAVASDLPALENRAEYRKAQNSMLTDVRGKPLALLTSNTGRIIINHSEISPAMEHAIISIEDRRYYEHPGVDLRGTARALSQDIVAGGAVQGGSTITQQFVKNATKANEQRTVFNKLREAALAFHLTRKWSKEKILTEYLNSIYFGNGAYGIESAARTYFGQDINHKDCGGKDARCASQLKPYEAALIAGVVSNPTAYDPVTRPRQARDRRDLVLQRMYEQGYITRLDYERGKSEPLPAPEQIRPPQLKAVTPGAGYFASWVRQQAAERYGPRRAFEGGLRIQTTLDLDMQERAEASVNKWLGNPAGPSASMVVIDNGTGEVRAMVGGRNYDEKPFNLATQGQRQPGSSFKPFVLAAALRAGIGPGSVWPSRKREFVVPNSGGKEHFVVNNYEGNYAGSQTLAGATTFSDNSVYAAVGIDVGVSKVAKLAKRMGIRTPVSKNYAMTLGGLKQGVTALDMAHAYETFATGGKRVTGSLGTRGAGPVGIRSVRLRSNRKDVIARNKPERKRILSPEVANTSVNILQSVVTSGTAKRAALGDGVRAWGKTGTTEDYGDAWFVGSTERYTVAVWVGYADKVQSMKTEWQGDSVAGGTYPAAIWHDFMKSALELEKTRLEDEAEKHCKSEKQKKTKKCQELGLGLDETDETTGTVATPSTPVTPETGTTGADESDGEDRESKPSGGTGQADNGDG
ncbi:MAG: transglycosylase domain-containing protein, partial [Solirubrobacteraceae bacterium]|nr:transglycosylase domain-containing protein [Solirubrobacteraceae bacterium]